MIQTVLGIKGEQTQKFLENGRRIPVTKIHVGDNVVVQIKTQEKDSYAAMQIGFKAAKKPIKSALGHAKKANLTHVPRFIRETRVDGLSDLPDVGQIINISQVFKLGDFVSVTGVSKGKGFAGVVKRHNFRGGPKTHGQSDRHRAPGSIGQTTTPGRVYKGKRMAGHMGTDRVTVSNLQIVDIDTIEKTLYVLGLIPGPKNNLVIVKKFKDSTKFIPLINPIVNPDTNAKDAENAEVSTETQQEETKTPITDEAPASATNVEPETKSQTEEVTTPDETQKEELKEDEHAK